MTVPPCAVATARTIERPRPAPESAVTSAGPDPRTKRPKTWPRNGVGDPRTVVGDLENRLGVALEDPHRDRGPRGGVADGVVDQVQGDPV